MHTAQGNRRANILEHAQRRSSSMQVNPHLRGGHFTQLGRSASHAELSARHDYEGWGTTDRPLQSFTRTNPAPLLTSRTERAERDAAMSRAVFSQSGDPLNQSWMGPRMKSRKDIMVGRKTYHHGHESRVDQRRLDSWSTYPFLTRLEPSKSNGQVWDRTMPVEDPGDAGAYTHQQKQIMTSSSRIGSFWYDAQKHDNQHGCRPAMDSVWFGSLRRQDSGDGHQLGNLRARGSDSLDRPEIFQGTTVYSNTICYGR
jgi:hypothetical protein